MNMHSLAEHLHLRSSSPARVEQRYLRDALNNEVLSKAREAAEAMPSGKRPIAAQSLPSPFLYPLKVKYDICLFL